MVNDEREITTVHDGTCNDFISVVFLQLILVEEESNANYDSLFLPYLLTTALLASIVPCHRRHHRASR